ncbi:hypothetical protein JCM14635_09000 [Megalodesulfovibrio paquesii]
MNPIQWITSASLSAAVLAAALFPPVQADVNTLQRNKAELERVLLTCGNHAGAMNSQETGLCLQWWSARQGSTGTGGACFDCLASCGEHEYSTCRNSCINACGSPEGSRSLQKNMAIAEKRH